MERRLRLVERLEGEGRLVSGRGTWTVSCVLYIYQEVIETSLDAPPLDALRQIEGRVLHMTTGDLWDLEDQDLTLFLADGRSLPCQVDLGGRIIPSGYLRQ